ncbi:MAG: HD domain-containing protein [Acidobacteria bacterium]|nr:HD domain-containing protein [Acidobacteriota bacterium]
MPTKRNEPIASWNDGDTIEGFALLSRKERRQDRNGNTFLDLVLTDASGSIAGKVWSDSPALEGDYSAHSFVAVRGQVKDYRGQLQVSVQRCREATETDREHGFEEALLVPTTHEDIGDLYNRLERMLEKRLQHPLLRRLGVETLATHGRDLREHPAAKSIHHAYRGGLLEHTVSMAELALAVAAHYPKLDSDLLLLGVLFHDLGKLDELGAMPANDYTRPGRLVGHIVLGRDMLRERCAAIEGFPADLQLHLEHLVLSHHGQFEFGSPVLPMTPEALALAFIDNLDSKLAQLWQAGEQGGGMQYLRSFGRFVLLPENPADENEDETGAEQAQLTL